MRIAEIKIVRYELDCVRMCVTDSDGRFITLRRPPEEDVTDLAAAIKQLDPSGFGQLRWLDTGRKKKE